MDKIQQAAQQADQCVKCGLCLQFCPTFQLTQQENESPRGRVSLIQGLASGKLQATKSLTDYLDHCLQCRTCERVCPSNIEYGSIIKLTREHLNNKIKKSPALLRFLIQTNLRIKISSWFLWVYQILGLQKLLKSCGFLGLKSIRQLDSMLPDKLSKPKKLKNYYHAIGKQQGEVDFFPGCVNKMVDLDNCHAAINLLQHFGFNIKVSQQACCGALDELSGNIKSAKSHELNNINKKPRIILTLATGCLAHIKLAYDKSHSQQYDDLLDFLAKQPLPSHISFKPLNKTAVIHQPCTQRNALKLENTAEKLLAYIPELKLSTPPCKTSCCGSAGDYSLKFHKTSKQLADNLTKELTQTNPEILITSNIGCSLQFQNELKQLNKGIKVLHPIVLLSQQIDLEKQ